MRVNRPAGDYNQPMILAGDIGGTKTHLGLFAAGPSGRPVAVRSSTYPTLAFDNLEAMVRHFIAEAGAVPPAAAAFGVAGPVRGRRAELTNVPWVVDAEALESSFRFHSLTLLNDLQAMAYAVPVLEPSELRTIQEGRAARGGNRALIAAGTGLGEALLHEVDGRLVPSPTEGGHTDFAPRTELEIGLLRMLIERNGRAEYEDVLSGPGLVNIYRFLHDSPCPAAPAPGQSAVPASITRTALERACERCVETLDTFVSVYGAEAGNLALRCMATGGVYIGGGIAPKILDALVSGRFIAAFRDKGPMAPILDEIPVRVIMNQQVGLLGAAVAAVLAEAGR